MVRGVARNNTQWRTTRGCSVGRLDLVEFSVERAANIEHGDYDGRKPLFLGEEGGWLADMVGLLYRGRTSHHGPHGQIHGATSV
jgi:hypothetical protein